MVLATFRVGEESALLKAKQGMMNELYVATEMYLKYVFAYSCPSNDKRWKEVAHSERMTVSEGN